MSFPFVLPNVMDFEKKTSYHKKDLKGSPKLHNWAHFNMPNKESKFKTLSETLNFSHLSLVLS